jgi:hypothetical protein
MSPRMPSSECKRSRCLLAHRRSWCRYLATTMKRVERYLHHPVSINAASTQLQQPVFHFWGGYVESIQSQTRENNASQFNIHGGSRRPLSTSCNSRARTRYKVCQPLRFCVKGDLLEPSDYHAQSTRHGSRSRQKRIGYVPPPFG